MSNIKFVSHENFPDDPYVKEMVYLCLEERYRVAYVRKESKTGGKFWSVPSFSTTKDGTKSYHEGFMQDSKFLENDIKNFLNERSWEKGRIAIQETPTISAEKYSDLPF